MALHGFRLADINRHIQERGGQDMPHNLGIKPNIKKAMRHPDKLGKGAEARRKVYGKNPVSKKVKQEKAGVVMREFHRGTLRHGGTGKPVPKSRPDIAKAIAMSEAGLSKKKKS